MKLIFVRHGEAESNATGTIGGQLNVGLTEKGTEQAKKVSEALKNEKFDLIFCSSLKRADDTLKEIKVHHKDLKVIYDDRLMEMNFGKFEGKPRELVYDSVMSFECEQEDWRAEGGESFKDLINRANEFLEDLKKHDCRSVLVVAHGGIIRTMFSILLNKPLKDAMTMWLDNTSVTEIDINNGKAELKRFNVLEHLEIL